MKLNIGCGYNRLEGWLNLDSSQDSAADRIMPAHDLAFPPASVSEIKAQQLVEHLGFFRTRFFLSECWRVLAPGGALTLETPHIEKTFGVFLAGDRRAKEAALGWIYGSETPGMNHLYCFPGDLLAEIIAGAGFEVKHRSEFDFQPYRPALRIEAVKKSGEKAALNAALRRRLLDKGLAVFVDELESAGLEQVIGGLLSAGGDPSRALAQALYNAPAALEYFTLEEENEERASREAAACARLAGWNVQGRLAEAFRRAAGRGLPPAAAFEEAIALGRELTGQALAGSEVPAGSAAAGAPAVFTAETAAAWMIKTELKGIAEAAKDLRERGKIL